MDEGILLKWKVLSIIPSMWIQFVDITSITDTYRYIQIDTNTHLTKMCFKSAPYLHKKRAYWALNMSLLNF